MSGNASIITPFIKRPSDQGSGSIMLEQQPWDKSIGKVPKLQIVRALGKHFFDYNGAEVDCGMDAGGSGFQAMVYAYPSPDDLPFKTGITHGLKGAPTRAVVQLTESLSFGLDRKQSLDYPVKTFLSSRWLGQVFSAAGSTVGHPAIVRDGQDITVAEPVYGTVEIRYTTVRYEFPVHISARDAAIQDIFQSVFYAWWDGGIELISLTSPANAEDGYLDQVDCTGVSSSLTVIPPDDQGYQPTADPRNKEIYLSYCEDFGNE